MTHYCSQHSFTNFVWKQGDSSTQTRHLYSKLLNATYLQCYIIITSLLSVHFVSWLLNILNPSLDPQLCIPPLSSALAPFFFFAINPVYSFHISYTSSFLHSPCYTLSSFLIKWCTELGRRRSPGAPKPLFNWFKEICQPLFEDNFNTHLRHIVENIISALRLRFLLRITFAVFIHPALASDDSVAIEYYSMCYRIIFILLLHMLRTIQSSQLLLFFLTSLIPYIEVKASLISV